MEALALGRKDGCGSNLIWWVEVEEKGRAYVQHMCYVPWACTLVTDHAYTFILCNNHFWYSPLAIVCMMISL